MIFGKESKEDFLSRTYWVFPNIPWWGDKGFCEIRGEGIVSFEEGKRRLFELEGDLDQSSFFDSDLVEEEYCVSEMLQISHEFIGEKPYLVQFVDSVTGEILREERKNE